MKPKYLSLLAFTLVSAACSTGLRRDLCGVYRTEEEFRACERGRVRAEEQNWRDRLRGAERSGYDIHRERAGY